MKIRNVPTYGLSFLAFALMALAFASCTRFGESSIKLPTNPILSGGLGWAVVKDAYVRLKESPSDSSKDLDHLRRGGVFVLDARKLGGDSADSSGKDSLAKPTVWYGISSEGSKGWVRESELDIYASQAQAEKAASAYR
jgi:hypothetical protein